MNRRRQNELINELCRYENYFNSAANKLEDNIFFPPNFFNENQPAIKLIYKNFTRYFLDFIQKNSFFLCCTVPEQREEIFRELKSLLPEQPELVSPDCLTELQASVPVQAMHDSYDVLTSEHWESFFRTLAGIAYCVRSELEARKG